MQNVRCPFWQQDACCAGVPDVAGPRRRPVLLPGMMVGVSSFLLTAQLLLGPHSAFAAFADLRSIVLSDRLATRLHGIKSAGPGPGTGALNSNRREASALLLIGGFSGGAVVAGTPASAVDVNMIVEESKANVQRQRKIKGLWNPESYKVETGNYNSSNLKSFLPTVFLGRRAFEGILKELSNPKANLTDPDSFYTIRQQNREKPISKLRKEGFRTKTWIAENTPRGDAGNTAYERMKRALDDQDTQLLLITRTDTPRVDSAAVRVAKRNVETVIDAIDQLIEILPEAEAEVGRAISARRAIPVVKIPLQDKYNMTKLMAAKNASAAAGNTTS